MSAIYKNGTWYGKGGSGSSELSELEDVTLTSPASGDVLKFDGEGWVNGEEDDVNLSELKDVTLSSAANGDILKFNGTKWVNDKKFNYSTTEQVVGTWIDGRNLYQKTLQLTSPSTTGTEVSTGLTNIRFCFIKEARIHLSNGYNGNTNFINTVNSGSSLLLKDDGTKVFFVIGLDEMKSQTVYVTVCYTKTTD